MSRVPRAFAVATLVLALALAAFGLWLIWPASMPRLLPGVSTDASTHSVIVSEMIVPLVGWIAFLEIIHRNSQLPPSESDPPRAVPPATRETSGAHRASDI